MSDKCESCGIEWTEHLGITGTCKRVQDQAAEIERLKAEIEALNRGVLEVPNAIVLSALNGVLVFQEVQSGGAKLLVHRK